MQKFVCLFRHPGEGRGPGSREQLGWVPRTWFDELVRTMVEHDLESARQKLTLTQAGHRVAKRRSADG